MYGYIYITTDNSNGKIYIGQHKSDVFDKSYYGSGVIISRIKEKRPQDLTIEVIEWCKTKQECNEREIYWISEFNSQNPKIGYNRTKGGDCGGYWLGKHRSEETKKKLSYAIKGKKHPNYGKHRSEETKQKIREGNKNKVVSEQTRKKISEAQKGKPKNTKGIPHKKSVFINIEYDLYEMNIPNANQHHPDWILIEK